MTVLILTEPDDEHARQVQGLVETRGEAARFLHSADFPEKLGITYDPVAQSGWFCFPHGERIAFADVTSVYWRSYAGVSPAPLPDEEQAVLACNDSRSLFESVLRRLKTRWVNGWEAFQLHQTKPAALARIAELGIPVPATFLTNDPEGVIEFIEKHSHCIFKPVQGGAHTRRLGLEHLSDENLENLRFGPVTIQEEITGTDVRVFVAGSRVLACEIHTDAVDFRDDPDPEIVAFEPPADIVRRSLQIARALHLLWTGIDYRRTATGEYVFLEANPSPMFLGFERRCGLPLTEALVDLLFDG